MTADNRFNATDDPDEVIVGAGVASGSASVVEMYGNLGLDFAFLDLEHAGFTAWDSERLEDLCRAADLAGTELLVRIPSGSAETHPPLIRKVLDTGVRNILVPRVDSVEEARAAVEAGRFYTEEGERGRRGMGGGRSSEWGYGFAGEDYVGTEDATVQIGIMVENMEMVNNLDEYLSIPDLGFACIGPADLSHTLDQPLEFDHPDVQETIADIEQQVADSDVTLGAMIVEDAADAIDRGYQILILGNDYGAIRENLGAKLDDVPE